MTGWPGPPVPTPDVDVPAGGKALVTCAPGEFLLIRVDPRLTDGEFARCCQQIRARVPEELWPRLVVIPAEQFAVLRP